MVFTDTRRDEEVAAVFRLLNPKMKSSSNLAKKEESVRRHGFSRAAKGSLSLQSSGNFKCLIKERKEQ